MNIRESFRKQIKPQSYDALQRILAYRNENVIRRHQEDHDLSQEDAERAFSALMQFLAVSVFRDDGSTLTAEADAIWHTFLIHTRQYAEFCDLYLGGFLHQEPDSDGDVARRYRETRAFADTMFASLDPLLWPAETGRGARCISYVRGGNKRFS